jgi:hypothetical protein
MRDGSVVYNYLYKINNGFNLPVWEYFVRLYVVTSVGMVCNISYQWLTDAMLRLCFSVQYVVGEKTLHLQYVEDQNNTRKGNMCLCNHEIRDWETHIQLQNYLVKHMWVHISFYLNLFGCVNYFYVQIISMHMAKMEKMGKNGQAQNKWRFCWVT